MSYWKRLKSGEQDNVLQYWLDGETNEELIIKDTTGDDDYKGSYSTVNRKKDETNVFVEETELVLYLYEEKDLLLTGSIWTDGDTEFEVVDSYPNRYSEGHFIHPEDINESCVYVEYTNSDENDWIKEELFTNSVEVVEAGL